MPGLGSLFGNLAAGGGAPDISQMLNNPAMVNMAQQMMQNPAMQQMWVNSHRSWYTMEWKM